MGCAACQQPRIEDRHANCAWNCVTVYSVCRIVRCCASPVVPALCFPSPPASASATPRPPPTRPHTTGECLSAVLGVFRIRCLSGVLADAPCWALSPRCITLSHLPFTIFIIPFSLASVLGKGQIGKGSVRVEKQWRTLTYELWHVKSRCSGRVWAEMTEGILT